MHKSLRVSIVIPVYNEADRIADCLRAIAAQTVRPFEVIVIDNNSTDHTAALATLFPFVRLLREPKQGVVYARDHGFSAVRGDIIARIDADTLISTDWVAQLQRIFADETVDLVTGAVSVRDMSAAQLASRVDLFWRRYLYKRLGTQVGLQGANMALRKRVWRAVKHEVCHAKGLHEDFDVGLHANRQQFRAIFDDQLQVSVCHRQLHNDFWSFYEYAMTSPRTYLRHGVRRGRVMYPVIAFVLVLYPIIRVLTQGYDPDLQRFSWSYLLTTKLALRVNPATFVD